MKTAQISKMYFHILESMSDSDIRNAYFGSCNLTAEYLNDYHSSATNEFIGDFLETYGEEFKVYNNFSDIIENPDYLLQMAACEFHVALEHIMPGSGEYLLKNAEYHLETWGNFYLFCNGDIAQCWIIRAENGSEAYSILTSEFEDHFIVDALAWDGKTELNENGNPVYADNLMLLGEIKGE